MKRTIFFITCLSIFGFGISHDAYAERMESDRSGELCALSIVPVTDYDESNSSRAVELGVTEESIVDSSRNTRLQLALTRICISEAGFQVRTNDCMMIYHTIRTRSRSGELTLGIMRAYAPQSFNIHRTDSRSWIAHLRVDGREPRGWRENTTIPWSTRREGFLEVYRYVGDLLRTRPENACGIRIDHWGAPYFRRSRHIRNGWTPIVCGETLNQFWSLPPRRSARNNL
jgi:hypothetical protein